MKKNYQSLFNRCIYIDNEGELSNSFLTLAKKQKHLTFDRRYLDPKFRQVTETPFKEIRHYDNFISMDINTFPQEREREREREREQGLDTLHTQHYDKILDYYISAYKDVLRGLDKNEKYLFSCSNGSDSRIIISLLAQLRDEEGYSFDNILFRCWGSPEKDSFLQLMKRFKFDNISIVDDAREDPYDICNSDICVEGFYSYGIMRNFWGKDINPQEYILLSGAEGETLVLTYTEWVHSHGYCSSRGDAVHTLASIFKDIFFPYLTKNLLSIAMSIPPKYKNIKDTRISRDKLRTDICEKLGVVDIPMQKADYRCNISTNTQKIMMNKYTASRFYKDFNITIDPGELSTSPGSFSSKMWAFATTVYERIFA